MIAYLYNYLINFSLEFLIRNYVAVKYGCRQYQGRIHYNTTRRLDCHSRYHQYQGHPFTKI